MLIKKITKSFGQTRKLGENLAKQIIRENSFPNSRKLAIVLALHGDLGAGKTTFLQGFAKGLGIKEKILSPTYVIMKRFKIKDLRFKNFFHIDCYRLKGERGISGLDFKEIISNPQNIVAIEWPKRINKVLPKSTITIKFICTGSHQMADKDKREIKFKT